MEYPTDNLNLPLDNVEVVYNPDCSRYNSHQVHQDTFKFKQMGSSVKDEIKNIPQGSSLDTLQRSYPGNPFKQMPANAERTVNAYDNCHTLPSQQYNFPFGANVFSHGQFTCLVCQKAFSKPNFLRMHISIFHSVTEPLAIEVSQQNSTETQTKDDAKKTKDGAMKTKDEEKKTKDEAMKTKDEESRHQCDICKKPFTLSVLKQHLRVYHGKSYICTICEDSFAKKSDLTAHKALHTGDKPFMCNVCPKSFRQKTNLKLHLATHTDTRSFTCEVCQKSLKSFPYYKTHLKKHLDLPEGSFQCQVCQKYYGSKIKLYDHMRMHKDKSYLCEICSKAFVKKHHLVLHLRSHTGEKPYSCAVCPKSFRTTSCLKKHTRIHNGEKPYLCDLCGQAFTRKDHLKQHERTHKPKIA